MKINSLLSSRGISPDLVRRLKAAQSLGAVMRTAELLKALCYIDLSRSQLNDCEVKLQGLEHILDIETFQLSMNSKPIQMFSTHLATPTRFVDPVRDISEHNTSPVLAKQVFDLPKFALHVDCDCYKCGNISYRYLVFATTYIRAQLCVLQNQDTALDYFHGAFKIRQKLFVEKETVLSENWPLDETGVKRFSWQARFYIADYVQLLIDFCYFLKTNVTSKEQDALDIISLAINVCRKYKLESHPVYVSAKELALDNDFQPVLDQSSSCLSMYTI
jgi:predicted nucleic-acid-binding protein